MIDAWTSPTPSPQQFPYHQPDGIKRLLDKFDRLERLIGEKTSNLLGSAGIKVTRNGMIIGSSLIVSGDLETTGRTTINGVDVVQNLLAKDVVIEAQQAILAAQQATLTAQQADLAAKTSAIADLLTKVVKTDSIFATAANFSVSGSSVKVSKTVTVPAGMTKAAVSVTGRVFAYNSNTTGGPMGNGLDYILVDSRIKGVAGLGLPLVATGGGGSALNVAPFSDTLSGLVPGSTFTITVNAAALYLTWPANATNKADLSGTVSWYL